MKYLTVDEMNRLLHEVYDPHQRLMLQMGFLYGLRISEILGLTSDNIRDGYLRVQRLKGSEKTTQPIAPEIAESLYGLLATKKPTEKLFPMTRNGAYKLFQRAGKRAGIPVHKLHPHVLKHSCAMRLIKTLDIHELKEFLGHKSLASTGAYLNPDEEEVAKKAMKAMEGVFA